MENERVQDISMIFLEKEYVFLNDLIIHKTYADLLKRNHLETFQDFLDYQGGVVFRRNRQRSVVKMELKDAENRSFWFHMKRHELNWKERLKALLHFGKAHDGEHEWNCLLECLKAGIPTTLPVVFARKKFLGLPWKSMTVTEHLYDAERLEDFIPSFFSGEGRGDLHYKRKILRQLAGLCREFHQKGYNHNDFYLGHFFLRREPFTLYLIDLQRVEHHAHLPMRKRIKDLAQLYFSVLPIKEITKTECLRFMRLYAGKDMDRSGVRKIMDRVQRKCITIEKHTRKLIERVKIERERTGYW